MKKLLSVSLLLFCAAAFAAPEGMKINDDGSFSAGDAGLYLFHFGPGWQGRSQKGMKPEAGFPQRSDARFATRGFFQGGGSTAGFTLNETIEFTGKDAFRYQVTLAAPEAVPTETLFLSADLPAGREDIRLFIDGKEIMLPVEFEQQLLFTQQAVRILIAMPERQLDLSGNFAVTVQDNRKYGANTFSIRLANISTPPKVNDWKFSCAGRVLPPAAGERFPAGVAVTPPQGMKIGKADFRWTFFDENWQASVPGPKNFVADPEKSLSGINRFVTEGIWTPGKAQQGFRFREEVVSATPVSFRYSASLKALPPLRSNCLTFLMTLPAGRAETVEVDDRKVEIPEKFGVMSLFSGRVEKHFRFETGGRTVTIQGKFGLHIQDNRRWSDEIQYRILPTQSSGAISDSALALEFRVETPNVHQIDLSRAANMGFRDEVTGDGKGGWTDQGPENDLRMFRPGKFSFGGIDLQILDPAKNGGKSCIVLSGGQSNFPASATIAVNSADDYQYLYLLHASAWTPAAGTRIGTIEAEYADGAKREIPVVAGNDCGNWWEPSPFPNAAVAWTGENRESYVGLYFSQFPIGKTPVNLRFIPEGQPVWMIAGALLGGRQLDLRQAEKTVYYVAGEKWVPLEFNGKILAGSPLDFSRFVDKPAGKYGPVVINAQGRFTFRDAPAKRIRFFGPNLVGTANYLSKQTADDFTAKAMRMGYNTVRFHHFENGLLDRNADDSLTFDPAALDQLNYLFAKLKENGIYLAIDLYASRQMKAGDNVEEMRGLPYTGFEMKVLAPVSPSAMENWKAFARKLLLTQNPYTGMTWGEDPALYSLNLINEASLVHTWDNFPPLIPLYEKKFAEYLGERGKDTPANRARRDGLFVEFLTHLQEECIKEQMRFLKEELKLGLLVTDLNYINKYSLSSPRSLLDFVDNHQYWDHPNFPEQKWRLPHQYNQASAIQRFASNPRHMMPTRIFGKPFTVTEFNFCNPNIHRMEAAPLTGGYAGLQDWDGLYRFAWSHSRENMEKIGVPLGFDIVNDPQAQLAERIIHMLFVRGDVGSAKPAYAFHYMPEQLTSLLAPPGQQADYPQEFSKLGLFARIGTLDGKAVYPGVRKLDVLGREWWKELAPAAAEALKNLDESGKITSATGEIELDARSKSMRIVTPASEVVTFSGESNGKVMRLRNAGCYQTVALLSLDGKPLTGSRELLLLQLTNLAGNKQKFGNERLTLLQSFGELPILLERGRVDVELALPAEFKVEALKADGSSNGTISAQYRNGKLFFTADTAAKEGGVMAYHLTR